MQEVLIASVRGNSFVTISKWIRSRLDDQQYQEFISKIKPDIAATLTKSESRFWYPLEHLTAIYEFILDEIGQGDKAILEDLGHFIASEDLSGLLKPIIAFLSVRRALSRTPYLWPRYDDSGEFKVVSIDDQSNPCKAILELDDYEGGPLHCVIIKSWLQRGCEIVGGENPQVREISCRWKNGGRKCQWELTWN